MDEILWCDHSNEISSAVLSHGSIYLVQPQVVLTYESVDGILGCDNLNETSSAVLSNVLAIFLVCSSTFSVCG